MKKNLTYLACALSLTLYAETYTWNAGTTGDWNVGENWTSSQGSTGVPGENDTAIIPGAATEYTVTITEAFAVNSLVVGSDTVDSKVKLVFSHKAANTVSGDILIKSGATLTHLQHGTAYMVYLSAGGSVTIDSDAQINVAGCGYSARNGPGFNWGVSSNQKTAVASHGGKLATNASATYGSMVAPILCGSGGYNGPGGGVVRISAGTSLVINGTINVNGQDLAGSFSTGAGGSVYLTAKTLLGAGGISANGGSSYGCSGAGGRISICLSDDSGFSQFTGTHTAYGGTGASARGPGPAGTVYLKSGEGVESSKLIVDNNNQSMKESGYVELKPTTESSILGSIQVSRKGSVFIPVDAEVEVYGGMNVTGGTALFSNGTVCLKGSSQALLKGSFAFGRLVCEVPGKEIVFGTASSDTFSIGEEGALVLRGSQVENLRLIPDDSTKTWKLTLASTVKTDILYVSAANSDASAGASISATSSENLGGNLNWFFVEPIVPGEEIVWTGAKSDDFLDGANWNLNRPVADTDTVVVSPSYQGSAILNMPHLSEGEYVFNNVLVGQGASLSLAGSCKVTITNNLQVAGMLVAESNEKLICVKDVSFEGGSFVAGSSLFKLEGSASQVINLYGQELANFIIDKDSGEVSFVDGFKSTLFDVHSSEALTLSFAPGKIFDVKNCYLRGLRNANEQALTLRSLSAGETWKLKNDGEQFVAGVCVSDSDAQLGQEIDAGSSSDAGRNTGWNFDSGILCASWKGGNGNFSTPSNWDCGAVPNIGDKVLILASPDSPQTITVDSAFSIKSLFVGSMLDGGQVTLTFSHNTQNTVAQNVNIKSGVTLTHASGGTNARVWLDVGGNITIDDGAQINVAGCGYSQRSGPGFNGGASNNQKTATSSHGGRLANLSSATYGSLIAPIQCGSGGYNGPGGGSVRINAAGQLIINGDIIADGEDLDGYASGSGGSVWLSGVAITGAGNISANGGKASSGCSGAGGRVSLWVADSTGLDGWTGKLSARTGTAGYGERGQGAVGTVYIQYGDDVKNSTTIIDNGGLVTKENGYAEFKASTDSIKLGSVVVKNAGRVKLLNNARAVDLNLASANVNFNAGTNILTITELTHRDGKGWAGEFASLVTREIDPETGASGNIVWKKKGLSLGIR